MGDIPDGFSRCDECGDLIHRSADNHECPGSPEDRLTALEASAAECDETTDAMWARVEQLEEDNAELKLRVEAIERVLEMSAGKR